MNSLVRRSQNLRCVAPVAALIFRLGGTSTLRCQRPDRARSIVFITHVISANFLSNQDIPMPEQNAVKAYLANEDEMLAVTARSIVLEFPNGDMVEICWEPPHANDRRPLAIEIWGGRRCGHENPAALADRFTTLSVQPSAANLVMVRPQSYPRRQAEG